MAKNFKQLRARMSLEAQARSEALANSMAAMTLDELLDAMPDDERERVRQQADKFTAARVAAKPQ